MAVIEASAALNQPPNGADRLRASLRSAVWTFHSWNNKRMTRKALTKLSSRELQDIGLTPYDLENL